MELNNIQPPKLAVRLFRSYCRPDRLEELEGDLEEFYQRRVRDGARRWKADLFYWWNVFRCYKSYAKTKSQNKILMTSLFKSYFKLALRHSWKNKWPVTINVIGLGLALSLCVFLYMLYAYNLEFDRYYNGTDDIYRVHSFNTENGRNLRNEATPLAMDQAIRNDISGISGVSTFFRNNITIKKNTDYFAESAAIVSSDFDDMFEMPLKFGSWADFGNQPVVMITEELATKYFGTDIAVGEELTLYFQNNEKLIVNVAGVLRKIPLNTSFDVNIYVSQGDFLRGMKIDPNDWTVNRYMSHFLRIPSGQTEGITEALNRFIPLQNKNHETFQLERFELVPFLTPLLSDENMSFRYVNSRLRPQVLIIFTVLIGMVFLTACFNLANTSIALIANRLKEIGIRKTLGSDNKQILIQFLFEMAIICALAFVIAVSLANTTATAIMGLFSARFLLQDISLMNVILFIIGFLMVTILVAGLLPGLYAWKFQPVEIMRKSIRLKGVNWLNKTLIVAQYVFSIAVLIAGITFSRNADFLENLDIGYVVDDVIDLRIEQENFGFLKQKIEQIPGVSVAGSDSHFGRGGRHSLDVTMQLNAEDHTIRYYAVGDNYLDIMQLKIMEGRGFLAGSQADVKSILVNQSFVAQYFEDQDPINQVIKIDGERKTIVGVATDILEDVYQDAEMVPSIIGLASEDAFRHLVVRTSGDINDLEDQLRTIWSENVDRPYTGRTQEDVALGTAGRDTKNLKVIFLSVAILSGFLSIVGIFSLAKLNITKRIKEITIRKVLGATIRDLLYSINKSFSLILFIALILGCGLGYMISEMVLSMIYKYYVQVSLIGSVLCGMGVIFISYIMLSGVAIEPANSNPVTGLRED